MSHAVRGTVNALGAGGGGGGGAVTVADGADSALGSTTDAAVYGDNDGTLKAAVRGEGKIWADVYNSISHWIRVDGSGVTQPVSAASLPLPSGASTLTAQNTGNTSLGSIDTKLPSLGQALAAGSVPVVLPSAQLTTLTPPAAITGFATETTQLLGLTISDFDSKTGALTETAPATDTASSGLNGRLQRIAQRISSLITALGSPFQAGGSIGNTTFASTQSGTWTVQPGNTANTTAWKVDGSAVTQPVSVAATLPVNTKPATSGGVTPHQKVSAGSTNATNVKASAGQVFGWFIYNSNAAARKVMFHNSAGTPTAGASTYFPLVIPPLSAANVLFETGIEFTTGIAYTMVTGLADNDSTGVAANDLVMTLLWK